MIQGTEIIHPRSSQKGLNAWHRRKRRDGLRKRNGIEAIISHLKGNYRLYRTYLKGLQGDYTQLLLAASAYNLALWTRVPFCPYFRYYPRSQ